MARYNCGDQDQDVRDLRRDLAAALRNGRKIVRMGEELAEILHEAISSHIYEDREPRRCPERKAINAFHRAVKQAGY